MKTLLTIAALCIALSATAQTKVTKDAQGNYTMAKKADTSANKATGHTIIDKDGISHPVYISSRGKLYWLRTSKSGNVYKSYIKD